jgi:RND superfamily putative drug exporter
MVLIAWLIIVAVSSPFASKLGSVQENDDTAWLPSGAESLKVSKLQEEFTHGDTTTAVVVYYRADGLTATDQSRIDTDRQAISSTFPGTELSPTVTSDDGHAAMYTMPLDASGDGQAVIDGVGDLRGVVSDGTNGLQVKVTGPAGFMTDLVDVFSGIDTTLLAASAGVVAILLLLTYRSPFVWIVPLLSVAFAHQLASGGVYGLAKHAGLSVNGQSGGILPVLVFGAGTDYALLLISRYREELRRHEDKHEAMAFALRQAGPAILASSATVIAGLLCLLAADLNPTAGLGPVGAVGIASALVAMLTLLPAILVMFGRRLFWPFVPHFGSASHETSGVWARVGHWVSGRPRTVWVGTVVLLVVLALGLLDHDLNLPQKDQFTNEPEAITGQKLLARSFPAGASEPAFVIADASAAQQVQQVAASTQGVAGVQPAGEANGRVMMLATFTTEPGTEAAYDTVDRLRETVHAIPDANALVGGTDATSLDIARANSRDRMVIMPLVLLVVLVILGLLLRAVVAPIILILTVVLSFAAALGTSVVVFDKVFGFAGLDPSMPLLGFVFLVALGIDYNIFLMSRVHEEAAHLGTHEGMLRGLAVTGGVITSAGLVLAATFGVLGVMPLVAMAEMGFIVAFGVLLDTLIVRSVLVPALTLDIGRHMWWPSRLSRQEIPASAEHPAMQHESVVSR